MTITHKTNMDLVSKGIAPKFDMVQGDYCARQIEFRLFSNNTPWIVPSDAMVLIRYRRPDKSVGVYNTMPDGSDACTISGNTLSIAVAPEALAMPGTVTLVVTIYTGEQELSTFEVQIEVQPNLSSGAALDGNYASITGMLPIPDEALPGQVLVVDEVSDDGKVRTVKACDFPKSTQDTEIPNYVIAEAERVAAQVQSHQNAYTVTFFAGTDIHADLDCPHTEQMLTSMKHAAQAMEIIRQKVHIDFGVMLGDHLAESSMDKSNSLELYRKIHSCFHPAFVGIPQFWLKGDHDYSNDELTDQEVYSCISIHNNDVTKDPVNRTGGYFYRDFDDKELRVVCLALPIDGTGYSVTPEQANWFRQVTDLSELGGDWKCLILSHMPITSFQQDRTLIGTLTYNEDYLIANIHGHCHNQRVGLLTNISAPEIGIPSISPYHAGNESESDLYEKVPGTARDTAFCVVTVDLIEHIIFLDHYGAGEDRVIETP